jgi:hypothetical protein
MGGTHFGALLPPSALKTLLEGAERLERVSPVAQSLLQRGIAAGWADQASGIPDFDELPVDFKLLV